MLFVSGRAFQSCAVAPGCFFLSAAESLAIAWTMHQFVAVVLALALAAILWRLVRWMTKQSNAASKGVPLPADNEGATDKLKLPSDKTSEANASAQSSIPERCISKNADLMQCNPAEPIGEKKRLKADETSRDILQLELCQERKLRERAEDWAEFLTRELEAHIRARIEAERRYHRLQRQLNSASPKVLIGNDNKPASRNFKDIGEARQTWQKTCDLQSKQQEPGCLTHEPEHDENEWRQIVDANKRILQTTKTNVKQKDERTTRSHNAEEQCLQGNGPGLSKEGNMEDLNAKMISIVVEECVSPGEEQKVLESRAADAEVSDSKSYEDFTKLRMPFHDQQNPTGERTKVLKGISNSNHETNQSDKAEIDKNPLVCTESLSNIKETTEKWENLSALKETLGSTEDLSPSSADPTGKKGLQVSCSDITQGLVKKNQKIYETSETAENAENQ